MPNTPLVSTDQAQTITGIKTFTGNPVFNAAGIPIAAITPTPATDSLVAHLAGIETITGVKTFSGGVIIGTGVSIDFTGGVYLTNSWGLRAPGGDITHPVSMAAGLAVGITPAGGNYPLGTISAAAQLYPGPEALGAGQASGGVLHSTGVPSNANGNNNDWCISDNGHLYLKAAGAWVQKDGGFVPATTLAAAIAPDLNVASQYSPPALAASQSVANPLNPVIGDRLIFLWTQDATGGRVITYGTAYKTGGAAAFATTLSTVTIDTFSYNGTNWRITSRVTGQAV